MNKPNTEQLDRISLLLQTAAIATHNAGLDAIALALDLLAIATATAATTNGRPHGGHDEPEQPHEDDPGT
ncbi:MAG: hypothetical protein WBD41_02630 [Rhodococcus sp. (in: high G+C Gram-positive bacteria)]